MPHWMIGPIGRMLVSSGKVDFSVVTRPQSSITPLGGLLLDKRDTLGPKAILDLRDVTGHLMLARDLLAALDEHASPGQIASDISISGYSPAIRTLLKYCSDIGAPQKIRMRDIGDDFLLDYRSYIRVAFAQFKNEYRRRLYGNLERLLKAGQELGLAPLDLEPPRNFGFVRDSDATQGYSAGEALDIEDSCRKHIRELLARLDKGQELLRQGKDPRGPALPDPVTGRRLPRPPEQRPWNQLPNLLWFVVNVMGGQYVKYAGSKGTGLSSFNNATNGAFKGPYRKADVFSHLYPFAVDMIPFIILLAKTTGRNESSILGLRRDCLQEIDGRFILWYRKDRGADRLYKKVIANDGPFSPVALIKTVHKITKDLVAIAKPEYRDYLFLGFTLHTKGADSVKPLDPAYIKSQMNRVGGWCEKNRLQAENGELLKISLRRWRVYYLTKRYRQHGQLGKVTRDAAHTLSRTSLGYVDNDSTRHVHEQATEDGIRELLRLAQPTVVVGDSVQETAMALGSTETEAESILRGEQDVFFASCRDYYNRPGGPKNTPCDKAWACFSCPNAIITRHLLPRVIAFRNFIAQQKVELTAADWASKFADVWQVLNAVILPKFSSEAINDAERYAANEKLYIPIAWKA